MSGLCIDSLDNNPALAAIPGGALLANTRAKDDDQSIRKIHDTLVLLLQVETIFHLKRELR
jgi:hypothetical protein